jgi:uncharacterized protein YciW
MIHGMVRLAAATASTCSVMVLLGLIMFLGCQRVVTAGLSMWLLHAVPLHPVHDVHNGGNC